MRGKKDRCLSKIFLVAFVLLLLSTGQTLEIFSKAKKDSSPVGIQVALPGSPINMALNIDGSQLAVLHDQGVSLIDIETGTLTENLHIAERPSPAELHFGLEGKSLYFTTGGNRLTRYIVKSGESHWVQEALLSLDVPGTPGECIGGFDLSPNGRYLALTLVRSKLLLIYDLLQKVVVRRIPVGANLGQLLFSPDGQKAYLGRRDGPLQVEGTVASPQGRSHDRSAANSERGFVSVVKLPEQEVANEIEIGILPRQMCLNKDGSRLYVLDDTGSRILSIDTLVQEVIEEFPLAIKSAKTPSARPSGLCLAPDGRRLFVVMEEDQGIAVIGLGSLSAKSLKETPTRLEGIIPMPGHPRNLLFTTDGNRLLVGLSALSAATPPENRPPVSTASATKGIVFLANLPSQKQLERWLNLFLQSHKQNLSN